MKFLRYLIGTAIQPGDTLNRLIADRHKVAYGLAACLLIGVLYTITVAGLAIVHARIMFPAWLPIPADQYYFWEMFFTVPVFIFGWILAAGIAYLSGRWLGGSGTFEDTLACLAFAMAVPTFVMWLVETTVTALTLNGTLTLQEWAEMTSRPGFWQAFIVAYQLVAFAWYAFLFPVAITQAQKLRWKAVATGALTLVVFSAFEFIFIR